MTAITDLPQLKHSSGVIYQADNLAVSAQVDYDVVFSYIPELKGAGVDTPDEWRHFIVPRMMMLAPRKDVFIIMNIDRRIDGKIFQKTAVVDEVMRARGLVLKQHKIWVKSKGINFFRLNFEHIHVYAPEDVKPNRTKDASVDVFEEPFKKIGDYASACPLSITQKMIAEWTKPGDVVYDPFMGSGTTAMAAANLGLTSIGCEIDPAVMALASERLGGTDVEDFI